MLPNLRIATPPPASSKERRKEDLEIFVGFVGRMGIWGCGRKSFGEGRKEQQTGPPPAEDPTLSP